MFSTKDMLYQFSGGWLYSRAVDAEFRRLVDVELVGLRMSGEVSHSCSVR